MALVIAIDAGTTGVRSMAADETGGEVAYAYRPFPQHYPGPGLVEHEGQTVPPELSASRVSARSIQRRQTPEDLTGAVLYLAASDSDFVTGQTLVVDGGDILY